MTRTLDAVSLLVCFLIAGFVMKESSLLFETAGSSTQRYVSLP